MSSGKPGDDEILTISYLKSDAPYKEDDLRTVPDCLRHYAETLEDREAMVFADYQGGREVVTWRQVYEKATHLAKGLKKLGVKEGEFVGINLRPCPEWLYLSFGTMILGATPVGLSFTYTDGSDLTSLMRKLEKCCLLALDPGLDGGNWNIVKSLIDSFSSDGTAASCKMPYLRYLVGHGEAKLMTGVKQLADIISDDNAEIDFPEIHEDNIAFMVQTSGSTGVPKLVAHTHGSVLTLRQTSSMSDVIFDHSTIHYNDRPFTWAGGYPFNFIMGQKRVTVSGFSLQPQDRIAGVIDIITRERCTLLTALPPMLNAMISKMSHPPIDWPVLATFTSGQPLTKRIADTIGRVSPTVLPSYGGSEFIYLSSASISDKKEFKDFYAGKMAKIPGLEAKIVDDDSQIVPVNTKGEIYIRSPMLFKGYYNDPEKTSSVMTEDGWYKTDDIGMMTEHGEFYVYGRKSNMIISGGMNVSPEIIEHAVKTCPNVASVVVVPLPDEVYYQVLCACVIRKAGSNMTEDQLRTYCSGIHNDKPGMFTVLPKYYMFLDKFPETSTGKTSRLELTTMAAKLFS